MYLVAMNLSEYSGDLLRFAVETGPGISGVWGDPCQEKIRRDTELAKGHCKQLINHSFSAQSAQRHSSRHGTCDERQVLGHPSNV